MKNNFLVALTAVATLQARLAQACMSDDKCEENECCYMNTCALLSSVECSTARMDIFKALSEVQMTNKQEVKEVVGVIREQFPVVRQCDELEDGCIDYIGLMAAEMNEYGEDYSLSLAGRL